MPGEEEVRLNFTARQQIARAIQQINHSLGELQQEILGTSSSMGALDGSAQRAQDELDEVGDEAGQATVSVGALTAASAGLSAALAGVDDDFEIPIDPDMVDDGVASLEDVQRLLTDIPDDVSGRDRPLFPLAKEKGISIKQLERDFSNAEARLANWRDDIDRTYIPVEANLKEPSVEEAQQEAEALSEDVTLNMDIGEESKIATQGEIEEFLQAAEAFSDVKVDIDIPENVKAETLAELQTFVNGIEDDVTVNIRIDIPEKVKQETLTELEAFINAIDENVSVKIGIDIPEDVKGETLAELEQFIESIEGANDLDINVNIPETEKAEVFAEINSLIEVAEGVTDLDINIDLEATDEALELVALASSLSAVQAQALATAGATKTASRGINDMGDEAINSAADMTALQSAASLLSLNTTALSLNVGAFNIALANLATQIPMLIGLLGTLLTAIMGVAGALVLAAGGIGAFIAAGAISEITRIEEQFSNIEDSAQAMQAIMRSLADAFREAISPLTSMDESAQIFYGTINNLLTTVHVFSQAIADSLRFTDQQMQNFIETGQRLGIIDEHASQSEAADSIMSLGEFMDEISSIISENADDIIASFKIMSAFLLPVLTSIIEYFVSGFDDMILFTTKFTTELAKLGPVFDSMIDFAVQLIDLTSSILQGLLPIFIGLISIATELATALNSLNNDIVRNIAGIVGLTFVVSRLYSALQALGAGLLFVTSGTQLLGLAMHANAITTALLVGRINAYRAAEIARAATQARVAAMTNSLTVAQLAQNSALLVGIRRAYSYAASQYAAAGGLTLFTTASGLATIATWAMTAAYLAFSAATGGLATALPAIALALGSLVAAGAAAVGVLGNMSSATAGLGAVLGTIKDALVLIVDVYLALAIAQWNIWITTIMGVVKAFKSVVSWGLDLVGLLDPLQKGVDIVIGLFDSLVDVITSIPEVIKNAFDWGANLIEDFINMMPDWLLEPLGISGEFSFTSPGEGMTVSRGDVSSGAEEAGSAVPGMSGRQSPNFNYTEENVNEYATEVNADPEDEERLNRVVKDAMEEAESFSRRQQGGM